MHALVVCARMRAIDWGEVRPARLWLQSLRLCRRHRSPVILSRREEGLNVVLFDHRAAMDRHAHNAWDSVLFFDAQVGV